jgi:hypothetical protein
VSDSICSICSGPRFLCGGCPLGVPRGLVSVPRLPRKVRYGESLIPSHWYRIVEIDPHDPDPTLKVGDVVRCAEEEPGCLDPENHQNDGMGTQWFADYDENWNEGDGAYRTLITELEEVEAPK